MLLAETRDSGRRGRDYYVIAGVVGGEEFEEGKGGVFAFEGGEKGLGFVAKAGLFRGVMNLPGEIEIGPVDVGDQR